MNKLSAVIIDDEFFNRKLISMLVTKINPHFSIDGEAENIRDGFKLINSIKPNIVFLDIKMPDGSGFDLLRQFSTIDFEVVFITGFDQYALQAFDFNALDYVLKPIDVDKFELTLEKTVNRINRKNSNSEILKEIAEIYNPDEAVISKIPIHYENKVVLLPKDEIMYVTTEGNSTRFTTTSLETHISSKDLSKFEFILVAFSNYLRINETTYVNQNYVHSYSKANGSFIIMRNGAKFEISNRRKKEVIQILNQKTDKFV